VAREDRNKPFTGEGFCVGGRWFFTTTMEGQSQRRCLGTMPNTPILQSHFCVSTNSSAHPHHQVFQGNSLYYGDAVAKA
jgi:hypothetical protein